jgi:hypothetical protein
MENNMEKTHIELMRQAAETIDQLGAELERARSIAVNLEQTMLELTEDEILALARKLDNKPVQSEAEDLALLRATNTIQTRAQDIIFAQMTSRRTRDGKDS